MSPAVDAVIALTAVAAVAWLALLADRVIRLLCHVPDAEPPRHRLADHPQGYRAWTIEQGLGRAYADPRHQRPRRRPRQGGRRERVAAERALTYWLAGDGVLSQWDRGRT